MAMTPSRFERVPCGTSSENACSPALTDDFRGLLLAAPERVTCSDDAVLPVAGAYQFDARFVGRFRSMRSEITLVAVDASTHAARSANLLKRGYKARPSGLGLDPSDPDLDSTVVTGWFNLDLFHWMTDLPRAPARYHVFATVGDVVSNVVTIAVVAS